MSLRTLGHLLSLECFKGTLRPSDVKVFGIGDSDNKEGVMYSLTVIC